MTEETAKHIGSRQALISVSIGLLIAEIMLTFLNNEKGFLKDLFWFMDVDYKLNLVIAIFVAYACAHVYGQMVGVAILIKHKSPSWSGILCGLLVLFTASFLSGWTGFFIEGLPNSNFNLAFVDYIIKPMFWVCIFGFIPVLFVGVWLGNHINTLGHKIGHETPSSNSMI